MEWFYDSSEFNEYQKPEVWTLHDFDVDVKPAVSNNYKKYGNSLFYFNEPMDIVKREDVESQYNSTNAVMIKQEPDDEEYTVGENLTASTKNGEIGICSICSKNKKIYIRSMCRHCYRTSLAGKRETDEWKKLNYKNCANCKELIEIEARGLCRPCYLAISKRSKEELKKFPTKKRANIICADCGQSRIHCAHNLCKSCYVKSKKLPQVHVYSDQITFESNDAVLVLDGIESFNITQESIDAFLQEVYKLYDKSKSNSQIQVFDQQEASVSKAKSIKKESKVRKPNVRECSVCMKVKSIHARDMCSACYQRELKKKPKKENTDTQSEISFGNSVKRKDLEESMQEDQIFEYVVEPAVMPFERMKEPKAEIIDDSNGVNPFDMMF